MSNVDKVLQIARKEIGYVEGRNNSNKYGKWYGMDNVAWCAQFVSWVLSQAGMPLSITTPKGFAYCPSGVEYFKRQKQWHTSNPKQGDIVFFDWYPGSSKSGAYHVGIVEKVNSNNTIVTIEGNTSTASDDNGGSVMRRVRDVRLVLGYGRPKYETVQNTKQITGVESNIFIDGKKFQGLLVNGTNWIKMSDLPEYENTDWDQKTLTANYRKK